MVHVLVISPEVPYPAFKGNQHRIDVTLRILISLGFEVSLAVLNSNQKDRTSNAIVSDLRAAYPELKYIEVRRNFRSESIYQKAQTVIDAKIGHNLISNIGTCPLSFRKCVYTMVLKSKPTHILVNYAKLTRAIPPYFFGVKVLDCHDIQTSILQQGLKAGIRKDDVDVVKYLADERRMLSVYDTVISINKNETETLKKWSLPASILTIPAFGDPRQIYGDFSNKKYDILFVGSASPFNVEGVMKFIAKSLPKLRRMNPSIKFAIAGDVSNCSAVKKVDIPNIIRLGRVDSLEKVYQESKVVVSPIISGAGMKVKNIEALLFGMPIVSTSFSMDGIEVADEISTLIRDDWDGFADAVHLLVNNESRCKLLSQAAFDLANQKYSVLMAKRKYNGLMNRDLDSLESNLTSQVAKISHLKKSENKESIARPSRVKALIFATDAAELIDYNVCLAKSLKEVNIYTEFVKMEPAICNNRINKHGFVVHDIRSRLDKERRKILRKEISVKQYKGDVVGLVYRGIDISEDVNVYKKMFPTHFLKPIEDVVVHGVLILEELLKLIDKIKPDFLVGWNGNGPHFIFLMKVAAKIKELPIFHVERGLLPDTFVFDPYGVNFKSNIAGSFLPLLSTTEREKTKSFIADYRKKSSTIVGSKKVEGLDKASVANRLGIDLNKGYIFFPMQIEGDSNIIINSPKYKTMQEVITDCLEVAKKLNCYLVCRPHPENKEINYESFSHELLIVDNSMHLYDMLRNSIANIVINSTVGLESIVLGMPTITLGHSVYSGKGISFDVSSAEDILKSVTNILSKNYNEISVQRRTEELIHLLLSRQLIDIKNDPVVNKDVLLNVLKVHGISYHAQLGKPGVPREAARYIARHKKWLSDMRSAKSICILNCLPDNTVQYLNGSKKPVVNQDLILSSIRRVSGVNEILVIQCKPQAIKSNIELFGMDESLVMILSKERLTGYPQDTHVIDEYFSLI